MNNPFPIEFQKELINHLNSFTNFETSDLDEALGMHFDTYYEPNVPPFWEYYDFDKYSSEPLWDHITSTSEYDVIVAKYEAIQEIRKLIENLEDEIYDIIYDRTPDEDDVNLDEILAEL